MKPPGSPGAVFRSFSMFRIVYKEGIEISRQFWNRLSPFFLNTWVYRGYSNWKATLEGPTVSFVHVEMGCRTRPSTHCSVQPVVPLCRFARPEIFTETHAARFTLNGYYRLSSYRVREFYGQQGLRVLLGTRTLLSALKKWMVWALLLNSWGSAPHLWLQNLHPIDTCNAAHLNTFILSLKFYCAHTFSLPLTSIHLNLILQFLFSRT